MSDESGIMESKKMSKYNNPSEMLSDMIIFTKYAKYIPKLQRREDWPMLCYRNADMHVGKYPKLADEIYGVFGGSVLDKQSVPSMRSFQFAGKPILMNASRMFNCSALAVYTSVAFSEIMYLLLGGSGVGYSIQKHHVDQLPPITTPISRHRKFIVQDSIMGWADSIKALVRSYFEDRPYLDYDFSEIRPKGSLLKTAGGRAPGPEPLIDCIHSIRKVFDYVIESRGEGAKLKPIEVHDIICYISDAVLAGGIRRSALISIFSHDDEEMLTCKSNFDIDVREIKHVVGEGPSSEYMMEYEYKGDIKTIEMSQWDIDMLHSSGGKLPWYKLEKQRQLANNSAILLRSVTSEERFREIMVMVENSKAGEPGIFWTDDLELFFNPCAEISLKDCQFCNLTEVNVSNITSQEDLNKRVKDATFLGTLQAGYTDFHYLRDKWRINSEDDALLGVSMTGIGSGKVLDYDISIAAKVSLEENERVANLIGINPAKRIGTVKPSGTCSLVLGTSSGIHAWHNDYFIRRFDLEKDNPMHKHVVEVLGSEFVEDSYYTPKTKSCVSIPMKAPEGSILRTETPMDLLERVKKFQIEWIRGTHREGTNCHNVSVTVSVRPDEWGMITDWMWENRNIYNGISLLDYDGGTYPQLRYEDITEEEYERLSSILMERSVDFDLNSIIETEDNTSVQSE